AAFPEGSFHPGKNERSIAMHPLPEIFEVVNNRTTERPVRRISGRSLAHTHLTRRQRAELAADLVEGRVEIRPTTKQAADLTGVPPAEVTKARRANGNGKSRRPSSKATETLADHIARSSPAERIEAARTLGPSLIWDSMIDPVITEQGNA